MQPLDQAAASRVLHLEIVICSSPGGEAGGSHSRHTVTTCLASTIQLTCLSLGLVLDSMGGYNETLETGQDSMADVSFSDSGDLDLRSDPGL